MNEPTTKWPLDPRVAGLPTITLLRDAPRPMLFRAIPPGRFLMGSREGPEWEQPRHWVTIPGLSATGDKEVASRLAFWMAEAPVTQAQFQLWTSSPSYYRWLETEASRHRVSGAHKNPADTGNPGGRTHDHPAENVTWWEAAAFCEWLARRDKALASEARSVGISGALTLRAALPSEACWEYACRAATTTDYWSGDGEAALREVGWFGREFTEQSRPVASLPPNPWGLYDMHGNVWEWCADVWNRSAYRLCAPECGDPFATESPGEHARIMALRGGSWIFDARGCRSANRVRDRGDLRWVAYGFRVCLLPGPVVGGQAGETGTKAERRARSGKGGGTTAGPLTASGEAAPGSAPDLARERFPRRRSR